MRRSAFARSIAVDASASICRRSTRRRLRSAQVPFRTALQIAAARGYSASGTVLPGRGGTAGGTLDGGDTAGLEEATRVAPGSLLTELDRLETEDPLRPAGAECALEVLAAAEQALLGGSVPAAVWRRYLDVTRRRSFLLALPDAALRTRWVATAFAAIRASGYSLADLLAQRVASHPDRVFLQASPSPDSPRWTYAQVARRLRAIAAALASSCDRTPRVAIVAENGFDGACCDLACLVHGIFVAPLAPYLSSADLG